VGAEFSPGGGYGPRVVVAVGLVGGLADWLGAALPPGKGDVTTAGGVGSGIGMAMVEAGSGISDHSAVGIARALGCTASAGRMMANNAAAKSPAVMRMVRTPRPQRRPGGDTGDRSGGSTPGGRPPLDNVTPDALLDTEWPHRGGQ